MGAGTEVTLPQESEKKNQTCTKQLNDFAGNSVRTKIIYTGGNFIIISPPFPTEGHLLALKFSKFLFPLNHLPWEVVRPPLFDHDVKFVIGRKCSHFFLVPFFSLITGETREGSHFYCDGSQVYHKAILAHLQRPLPCHICSWLGRAQFIGLVKFPKNGRILLRWLWRALRWADSGHCLCGQANHACFATGFCDWWCKFLLSGCVPLGTMFMWALPLDPAEAVVLLSPRLSSSLEDGPLLRN